MDYTHLKELLGAGDFQKADDETRILLIKLAGTGAVERKWVYFTEVCSSFSGSCHSLKNCEVHGDCAYVNACAHADTCQ